MSEFITIDLMPMLAGVLAALTCGILGNYLVLRKMSLMGDAISHAVLPGLVIAFIVSQSRSPLPMFIGAATAGMLTVAVSEGVKRFGKVEAGAAMGVVFSVLFALGVLLLESGSLDHVDLDADCVLNGQLETLYWLPPENLSNDISASLASVPRQVWALTISCVLSVGFVLVFFKELRISSFDAGLAASVGIPSGVMHAALMVLVACATVASFEAVGSILVIAMLICPAATARLLTDKLSVQVMLSAAIASGASIAGYALAAWGPQLIGMQNSLSASGMMTVTLGLAFTLAVFFSPSYGVLARAIRRARLAERIAIEDVLGVLYRATEDGNNTPVPIAQVISIIGERSSSTNALRRAAERGFIARSNESASLTEAGRTEAVKLVRRHRLWEEYLVGTAGVRADHVHPTAEILEHMRDEQGEPIEPTSGATIDPHGREIPGPTSP